MASELKPVYLLTGADRPKITLALRRLRDRVGAESVELMTANDASADDVVAACNARGLFGGSRVVIVEDVDRWKAADVKTIVAYLADPAADGVLALVAVEVKRDSALAKACAKAGEVLVYDVAKRDLPGWVAEQFARREAQAERDAARALVDLVGEDLVELATEVDKLATWAGGETITAKDVAELAAGRAELAGYEVTDAIGRRDTARALANAEAVAQRSGEPLSQTLLGLVGLVARHVRLLQQCQQLAGEGISSREAAARLKKHPFYVQKLFEQAANFSVDELRDALVRLAELDLALKGGSRLAGDLELARAVVEITRGREPARAAAAD